MLSGKACLATNVGSIPDMIRNNKTGILVNKQNPKEIYNGLKSLIIDDKFRFSISVAARNEVSYRNSIELFVAKFKELLNS
jgi:glycosyltransferase involved in cell wall biosynthesis